MSRRRGLVGVVLAVVSVTSLAVGTTSCSGDATKPTVAEIPTTTDPTLAADLEPDPTPPTASAIVAGLDRAVAAKDFCTLLAAIDSAEPDADDRAGATEVYRALVAATAGAQSFVPAELRTAWQPIVEGTDAAATAVADHDGQVHDPDVEAALSSTAIVESLQTVERYQMTNCAPPTAAAG